MTHLTDTDIGGEGGDHFVCKDNFIEDYLIGQGQVTNIQTLKLQITFYCSSGSEQYCVFRKVSPHW